VIRGDHDRDPFLILTEQQFDLTCKSMDAARLTEEQVAAMRNGIISISNGTEAVELSRVNHFRKVMNAWVGRVEVRLTSGPQKGKYGYVFAQWVSLLKGKGR